MIRIEPGFAPYASWLCTKSSPASISDVPRLRGRPAGPLGQPFYGWLGGATSGSLGRFNGLLRIRPLKRPEQIIAKGKPAVERMA